MEQSSTSTSLTQVEDDSLSTDGIEVCKILLNLPNLIHEFESRNSFPANWGAKGRRSAINRSPSPSFRLPPERKPKINAGVSSPATPLSFSPSESEDKTQQSRKKVLKKKTREELLETIEELIHRRELLTREIENVKGYSNKLKALNLELKAKKQELQFHQREPINKSINLGLELTQTALLGNQADSQIYGLAHHRQLIENIQYPCSLTPPTSSSSSGVVSGRPNHVNPLGLPDLNVSAEEIFEMELLQPMDHSVALDYLRARAAEARRRRMVRIKEMKLYNRV